MARLILKALALGLAGLGLWAVGSIMIPIVMNFAALATGPCQGACADSERTEAGMRFELGRRDPRYSEVLKAEVTARRQRIEQGLNEGFQIDETNPVGWWKRHGAEREPSSSEPAAPATGLDFAITPAPSGVVLEVQANTTALKIDQGSDNPIVPGSLFVRRPREAN